ncbi:NUDIX domain-containing protein [Sphingomonas donggukensis]|uniref:NUDIX domain-containing protein n=2 Tax=Sphingomonas donggukensis TaxID=2949093 RepID=A0ABY4TYC7_9SPHN|nr:NUDIX domain-containing protein [Sphingomonas donggukensis]URW77004.1 NUDIX domain-containing protein [Sphingomonas donggukensis]
MRDRAGAAPELLIVERSKAMSFAGGALVFPGGRVDAGDLAYAAGDDEHAARIAAVRECIEEAGVAPGVVPSPDAAGLAAMRGRLHAGEAIGVALGAARIDLDALVPFARWLPRGVTHRVFDTRFYLACLPDDAPEPVVDATENTRVFWATAAQVLADADAGRATIIFPTRRNLERLALFGSFAEAVAHARAHPVRTITPWTEARDGADHLCIPGDLGYPVTSQPLATALRA